MKDLAATACAPDAPIHYVEVGASFHNSSSSTCSSGNERYCDMLRVAHDYA